MLRIFECLWGRVVIKRVFIKGTLTFEEQVSVPRIGFGCGVNNQVIGMNNVAEIVGLGRGTLSLVSQLGSRKFSYCFTSIGDNKSSSLSFGSLADLNVSNGAVKSTPLIRNPILPSFYYLSLEGITVGKLSCLYQNHCSK